MRIMLAGLLLIFALITNAADLMTLTVNKNQKEFSLSLPSNPTTGYQWTVVNFDKSFLQLKASQYIAPKTKLIGAGGQMQFNFALVNGKSYPASTTLQFKYLRPWEPETGTVKEIRVNFQ